MEITFCDLRRKEVINVADGRRLGRIIDMTINTECGKICGIIVPGENCFSVFRRSEELFVPWNKITKIGDDVILVKLSNKRDDGHRGEFASTLGDGDRRDGDDDGKHDND